jgi:hypothetical protein
VAARGALLAFLLALLVACQAGLSALHAADNEPAGLTGAVASGYKFDRQEAAFRSGLDEADAAATTLSDENLATAGEFRVLGRANVTVSARFSAASQTCKVRFVTAWKSDGGTLYVTGISDEVTLTGSALTRGGKYVAPSYVFDGAGSRVGFMVLTVAPASGTVDLWVGSF